jgi:hypothetical protein
MKSEVESLVDVIMEKEHKIKRLENRVAELEQRLIDANTLADSFAEELHILKHEDNDELKKAMWIVLTKLGVPSYDDI